MMTKNMSRFRPTSVVELMESSGLSASALARAVGVSRQAVWAYSAGVSMPQFATVLRMAEVFDKPLDFFVERDGDVSQGGTSTT